MPLAWLGFVVSRLVFAIVFEIVVICDALCYIFILIL